ncbi:uncharacterized protein TM35_000252050 [Trypanosoma theileri]|uniref:Uncharacterized protein n=1 Tax=Trypanosoma theileri TaxID=67003 RepID=A0A1X0NRV0_9TRYP|nr:uncharacterized protein TM35_000252050 [Trypanosoma theileri]ORC86909.1 hypothetical protein TM35_000252050 [Trypanosoma theileri]
MDQQLNNGTTQAKGASQKSPTEPPTLRARRFPTPRARSTTSPQLSRRPTEVPEIAFRNSAESISDPVVSVLLSTPGAHSSPVDPFMTVIYPGKMGGSEEIEAEGESESLRARDNLGRTQVRVEGYFYDDGDDDAIGALIPNDLPRSTILYVLTASEGRDKLFKCLQYGLQVMICFLKRPGLFSPESQGLADYWAERFLRNSNTIRHGRGLFKVGRWLLNLFFLEEIYDRLSLKHGNQVRGFLNKVRAFLARFPFFPGTGSLLEYGKKKKPISSSRNSFDDKESSNIDSLVTDDMFSCIARVEHPWGYPTIPCPMSIGGRDNVKRNENENNAIEPDAARRFYLKERIMNNNNDFQEITHKQLQQPLNDEKEGVDNEHHESSPTHPCTDIPDYAAHDTLSSPPSIQSTLPASFLMDGGRNRAARESLLPSKTLLQPLRATNMDEEDHVNNSNDNKTIHIDGTPSMKPMMKMEGRNDSGLCHPLETNASSFPGYLSSYQTLPYEPRLGDALPAPRNSGNNHTGNKMHAVRSAASPINMEDEDFEFPNSRYNGSDINYSSSSDDVLKEKEGLVNGNMQSLPAEMGYPDHWRKRVLQFSTPLMLLLSVRSVATIGRRVLRDILLLSSKQFLDLLYVEKNRPVLQRRSNWLWLAVSVIDLILNTIRLVDEGWYKYATARHSPAYHCNCNTNNDSEEDTMIRYRGLVAQRKTNLVFPPVDLDFGAPICSSPAYFEAADPVHITPSCRICGCLFVETHAGEGEGLSSSQDGEEEEHHQHQLEQRRQHKRQYSYKHTSSRRSGKTNGNHNISSPFRDMGSFGNKEKANTIGETAEVAILFIPWLMRKLFNYIWLLRAHSNWTATILLQVRYMAEVFLAFQYCFGGYETGKNDASLEEILHPFGAIAGLVSAVLGLQRAVESAPK